MAAPLMLDSFAIQGDVIIDHEPLRVLTFLGRLYRCERIFPFTKVLDLAFALPHEPDCLHQHLYAASVSQDLITWDITFSDISPIHEQSYLIWYHWGHDTVALQLAKPGVH